MLTLSSKIKKLVLSALGLGYIALVILFLQLPDDKFHIYFLDIGQGDSIFIKTPQNHQILIDGGPKNTVIERLGEVMSFFDKSIDLIVLTHPHSDHMDGLVEVMKRYEVSNVLLTGICSDKSAYIEFLEEIYEQGTVAFVAEASVDFLFADVLVDVVYPFEPIVGESFGNLNNTSIVIRLVYEDKEVLLTGDLEIEKEKELISSGVLLKADILKAGHHGSKTSSSIEFLEGIKPEIAVIQCGKDNSHGHPHDETLKNFELVGVEKIYRNDLDETVEFVF